MSRRQQQATLVEELHARVHLTPLKEDEGHANDVSPMRNGASVGRTSGVVVQQGYEADELGAPDAMLSTRLFYNGGEGRGSLVETVEATATASPLKSNPVRLEPSPIMKPSTMTNNRRVIVASPAPRTSTTLLTSVSLAAQQQQLQSLQHQQHVVIATASASGSLPRAGSHDSDARLRSLLEEDNIRLKNTVHVNVQKISELEALVRELSATIHKQAADLVRESATVRGLQETLAMERASAAARHNPTVVNRPSSPNRGPIRTGSPLGAGGSSRSASASGSVAGITRTSSPSITRPTVSSARRSPHLPERRTVSPGGVDRPKSSGRTMSPIATRQQLATATFMRGTTASVSRTSATTLAANPTNERSSSVTNGAARPRLGGDGPASRYHTTAISRQGNSQATEVAPVRSSTTVVMQNGVVVPPASTTSTTRRITPARERVEAAIARMLPQQHRPQLPTSSLAKR
ncbi:Hypothetical protein, putative [Bodo saltans]|uniref:Uncharacterized protein n=1 Tax=Bodo saltans TaxID=75058 RepID=A0A0S4JAZ3_BODSA|nr:Hypothetical protein, putative [Bodo saltans]|eukprot:CUG87184.1 Hypothetical protein, putative [Bodo saltans]